MSLHKTIEEEMKKALKEGDSLKLSALRMVVSAIKTLEIEKKVKELAEADIMQIIQRQIKQHKESIEQFEKGKRQDLVDKESRELRILEVYLPKQLDEKELLDIIKTTIAESGAVTKSEAGKVMKAVMEKVRGKADGKVVNQLVMGLLK